MAALPAPSIPPPKSELPYPPIHRNAKFVILSDWDGTITSFDSNDHLTDNYGFGNQRRRELNIEVLEDKVTFRDAFREMLESVPLSFEECKEILTRDIKLDPGFPEFYAWCKSAGVPFVIVSSGMEPLIRAVLVNLIGEEDASSIDIISNDVITDEKGRWHIKYRHPDSGFGHDKSQAIIPYRQLDPPPVLFFFGDGVSDMSAAAHADVLFVKLKENGESDLAKYCETRGIPHTLFNNFAEALPVVQSVVEGTESVNGAQLIKDVRKTTGEAT